MSSVEVNDLLDELVDENKRLLNELLYANKCVVKSLELKQFMDSIVKQFVDYLSSDVKMKYEELSHDLNLVIQRDNTSHQSSEESVTSDRPMKDQSDNHCADEDNNNEMDISEDESIEVMEDKSQTLRKNNNKQNKYLCDRCGDSYHFEEVFELHIESCSLDVDHTVVSCESGIADNLMTTEEEEEEEVMDSQITRDRVSADDDNNRSNTEQSDGNDTIIEEEVAVLTSERKTRSSKSRHKCRSIGSKEGFRKYRAILAHNKYDQCKCDFPGCDYQTDQNWMVKRHLLKHSNARQFQCDYCDKNYKFNCDLTRHMKTKHLDQYSDDPFLDSDSNDSHFRTKKCSKKDSSDVKSKKKREDNSAKKKRSKSSVNRVVTPKELPIRQRSSVREQSNDYQFSFSDNSAEEVIENKKTNESQVVVANNSSSDKIKTKPNPLSRLVEHVMSETATKPCAAKKSKTTSKVVPIRQRSSVREQSNDSQQSLSGNSAEQVIHTLPFECHKCEQKFTAMGQLISHLLKH